MKHSRWFTLLIALGLLGWSTLAAAEDIDAAVRSVAKQLQCPVCESVNVADSPADLAVQMRGVIRAKLEAGESPAQILDYFVARYGDGILTEPPRRGVSLLVWLGPLAGIFLGIALLARRLNRPQTPRNATLPGPTNRPPNLDAALDELAELRGGAHR